MLSRIVFAVLAAVVAITPMFAARAETAADSGKTDTVRVVQVAVDTAATKCIVRIDRALVTDMRLRDTLDIVVECTSGDFAGFTLKFGLQSHCMEIVEVLRGEIPDSCHWEYFNAFRVNAMSKPNLPRSLWQVTALSKMSADTTRAACLGLGRPASIARLVVTSEHLSAVPDTTAAIFFYWQDCRDNVLSDPTGDRLMVSSSVFDYYPVDSLGGRDVFPTRFGTPGQCIDPNKSNAPTRVVEFHNGGVEFRLATGPTQSDSLRDSANH